MKVRFYQFSKRNKSTLLPSSATYREVECNLKDNCSILNPILLLQTFDATAYNYVYIPNWRRYYFISNSQYVEGMYEVALSEDYLATFKAEIGATRANVLYASGSTKNVVDARIPVTAAVARGHEYQALSGITITSGLTAIILGITGKGSFGCYLLKNSSDLPELLDGVDNWQTQYVTSPLDGIKQALFGGSAAECLKSAISLPVVVPAASISTGTAENIVLGNYPCKNSDDSYIQGYRITQPLLTSTTAITIPWQSSDWKRTSQYTTISLYLPLVGLMDIPATEAATDSSLSVHYAINVTSGDIAVEVYGTQSGKKFGVASGNCALNTPYGSTGINTNKMTAAIASGVGVVGAVAAAALTGGASVAAVGAIGAGIAATAANTVGALGGSGAGSGGLGGGASQGLDNVIHCFVTQKQLTDTQSNFNSIIGKPYMGVATVNSFSGYVQTDGFQFASAGALSAEKDAINNLLDSGIYFE